MNETRQLVDGTEVPETDSQKMTIDSKCPKKWLFVDLETEDIWAWRDDAFRRATPQQVKALSLVCLTNSRATL